MAQLQTDLLQAKSDTEEARKTCKRIEQQQQKQDKMPKTTEIRHQGRQLAQMHNNMEKLSNTLTATQEEIKNLPNESMLEDVAEYSADIVIQGMQELLEALDGDDGQFRDAAQRLDPDGQDEELAHSNTPAKKARALGSIFETRLKDRLLERCRAMGKRMKMEHPIYKDILAVRKAYEQLGQAQEQGECLELGNGNPHCQRKSKTTTTLNRVLERKNRKRKQSSSHPTRSTTALQSKIWQMHYRDCWRTRTIQKNHGCNASQSGHYKKYKTETTPKMRA